VKTWQVLNFDGVGHGSRVAVDMDISMDMWISDLGYTMHVSMDIF